jgi:hypothetical protein
MYKIISIPPSKITIPDLPIVDITEHITERQEILTSL